MISQRIKLAKIISKNCDISFNDARFVITSLKRKKNFLIKMEIQSNLKLKIFLIRFKLTFNIKLILKITN